MMGAGNTHSLRDAQGQMLATVMRNGKKHLAAKNGRLFTADYDIAGLGSSGIRSTIILQTTITMNTKAIGMSTAIVICFRYYYF
jgi:hypothetical protein